MKYAKLAILLALPVAFAVTLGAAPQPAEAGKACNELGLKSPCVRSSDVKPTLKLGRNGNDGDLIVRDENKNSTVQIDGNTGDVTNSLGGNGLAKAWATIAADGSIIDCWRCNMEISETQNLSQGVYEVDFSPLGTDIRSRPRLCTPYGGGASNDNTCGTRDSGDTSSIEVVIFDLPNSAFNSVQGKTQDAPFTLIIF